MSVEPLESELAVMPGWLDMGNLGAGFGRKCECDWLSIYTVLGVTQKLSMRFGNCFEQESFLAAPWWQRTKAEEPSAADVLQCC